MKRGHPPGGPEDPGEGRTPSEPQDSAGPQPADIESLLEEMRRDAGAWPSPHQSVFQEAVIKLREVLDEVQATEEELRRQNEELATAQLEAVIARERYQELFNFAPAAHLVTDLEGDIREANVTAAALMGVPHKSLFGKSLLSFIASDRRGFRARLAEIAGEGQVRDWNLRIKPHDGSAFDASVTVAVFRDPDGQRAELRWIVQDVSERTRAEEALGHALDLHRQVVESARDLITVIDVDGRIELASPSWKTILGYEPQEVLGRVGFELVHPDDLGAVMAALGQTLESGRGGVAQVRIRHKDGHWVDLETSGSTIYDEDGRPKRIVATSRDITERRRVEKEREELLALERAARAETEAASARLRKLQAITDAMLPHVGLDDLLKDLLDGVREALGSDTATILLVTPDRKHLAVRATRGERDRAAGEIRVPVGKGIAGSIAAERRPRIVPDVPKARPYSDALQRNIKSLVGVPLLAGDEVLGVVHAGTVNSRQFTEEDVQLLQLVAERAAVAIENARLYESEQEATRVATRAAIRAAALRQVTASLSEAVTTEQVARAIVDRGVRAMGAEGGLMALVTESGATLEIVRAAGYPDEMLKEWRRFPVNAPLPLSEAVSSRRPVLLESTKAREERYPGLQPMLELPDHALAAIPMVSEGRALGGLVFRFDAVRAFDEMDVQFMEALAHESALALERARLYEAEQSARREAELAQLRLAFLAEAGTILAGSLQIPEALESLGRLAVTFLTDLCLIDVLQEDGTIRRTVAVHADAERQPLADLLRTRYAPDPAGPHPAVRVMTTGEPEFAAEMPEDFLRRTTRDEEHYQIVRELGFQSYMCVPLITRGRVRGCFTLVSCNPDRRYGPGEVALAEELARRAAFAVDNGLLYEAEQQARREAELAASRLAFVAEASEAMSSSLDYTVTLQAIAQLAVPRLADWCLIDLLAEDGSLRQTAVAHRDPAKVALASELRDRYPPDRDPPHAVWRVLLSGEPELAEDITDQDLESRAKDPVHLRMLRDLGIRSHMVVPLSARGRILGVISLVSGESGRRYGSEDLLFAQDLGRRAAIAVDNSQLYRSELRARHESERAQARVEFLSEATASLSAAVPDYEATLDRVANLAVPTLADLCMIDVVEENGSIRRIAAAHADPSHARVLEGLRSFPPEASRTNPVLTVLRTGQPLIVAEASSPMAEEMARQEEGLEFFRGAPPSALMIFPLMARQRTLGTISLVRISSGRRYGAEEASLAQELARRAALVVDNARLYERQRHIARTLQRSLLPPSIPQIPGMELAARYRAAGEGNEVGGDFYDAFETADGAWILTIGDVCGKGAEAAAVTGLARHTIRAVSLHEPRPSRVLAMLNEAILSELSDERFCTVCCVRLRPEPQGARLTVCSGGHPLPLVLRADGTLETAGLPSMLLGVLPGIELSDHAVDLGPGDTIVLTTDGVIEEVRGSERSGPQRLAEVVRGCAGLPAPAIADAVERSVMRFGPETPRDDFAILVLRAAPGSSSPVAPAS